MKKKIKTKANIILWMSIILTLIGFLGMFLTSKYEWTYWFVGSFSELVGAGILSTLVAIAFKIANN